MAEMQVSFEANGDSYAKLAAQLRAAGPGLQPQLTAALRKVGQPAVQAAKSSLRSARFPARPTRGGGRSTGLRSKIAGAVTTKVINGGIRLSVEGKSVDGAYGTSLVLGVDGLANLRHPVFGNRKAWVSQKGSRELFYSALRPFESKWRAECEDVLQRFADRLS
jgi:hypothetical protein